MDIHQMEHQMKSVSNKRGRKSRGGVAKNPSVKDALMKVVYISTPMKVKTSASKFREIVQELTGRESDVVRIMEKCEHHGNFNNNTWMIADHQNIINNNNKHIIVNKNDNHNRVDYHYYDDRTVQDDHKNSSSPSSSSEEFIDQFDDVCNNMRLGAQQQQQSFGEFGEHQNLLYDSIYNQIDALGSY